jgi:Domain of unknown function (DUF4352)
VRATFSICLSALAALTLETGCPKPPPPAQTFRIGERVEAGPLIYNVLEAEWKSQIGAGDRTWIPSQRFLIVRLSVTNSGGETVSVPSLTLADVDGNLYGESIGGADVPNLWGLIRNVKPTDTMEGRILFDVEPKSYKLKLDDGSGSGRIAMVEMPLQFEVGRDSVLGANPAAH